MSTVTPRQTQRGPAARGGAHFQPVGVAVGPVDAVDEADGVGGGAHGLEEIGDGGLIFGMEEQDGRGELADLGEGPAEDLVAAAIPAGGGAGVEVENPGGALAAVEGLDEGVASILKEYECVFELLGGLALAAGDEAHESRAGAEDAEADGVESGEMEEALGGVDEVVAREDGDDEGKEGRGHAAERRDDDHGDEVQRERNSLEPGEVRIRDGGKDGQDEREDIGRETAEEEPAAARGVGRRTGDRRRGGGEN